MSAECLTDLEWGQEGDEVKGGQGSKGHSVWAL